MPTSPKGFTQILATEPPNGPDQINGAELFVENLIGESVDTVAHLPTSGSWIGRTVIAEDTGVAYWNTDGLTGWVRLSSGLKVALIKDIAQTSVAGQQTVVKWSTSAAPVDIGGFYSTASPTRLTAPVSGIYAINTTVSAQDSTASRKIGIFKNGAFLTYCGAQVNTTAFGMNPVGFAVVALSAGDYIEITAVDSVNLNVVVTGTTVRMELIA